mmetsp:Transcript_43870/g.83777  ORF Transcript_43870/g.83777 Transcript_43870/m.83777 type:complete len:215 (+) Transcript_43870:1066-1710(+)
MLSQCDKSSEVREFKCFARVLTPPSPIFLHCAKHSLLRPASLATLCMVASRTSAFPLRFKQVREEHAAKYWNRSTSFRSAKITLRVLSAGRPDSSRIPWLVRRTSQRLTSWRVFKVANRYALLSVKRWLPDMCTLMILRKDVSSCIPSSVIKSQFWSSSVSSSTSLDSAKRPWSLSPSEISTCLPSTVVTVRLVSLGHKPTALCSSASRLVASR